MTRKTAIKRLNLTEAQVNELCYEAHHVWSDIADDCALAMRQDRSYKVVSFTRKHVLELVLDASRLESYVQDPVVKACLAGYHHEKMVCIEAILAEEFAAREYV